MNDAPPLSRHSTNSTTERREQLVTMSSAAATPTRPTGGLSLTENTENYILVDIGANLTSKKYSRDLDSVVQRAKNAGTSSALLALSGTALGHRKHSATEQDLCSPYYPPDPQTKLFTRNTISQSEITCT